MSLSVRDIVLDFQNQYSIFWVTEKIKLETDKFPLRLSDQESDLIDFCQEFRFLSKNLIFDKNLDFRPQFRFVVQDSYV